MMSLTLVAVAMSGDVIELTYEERAIAEFW